MPTALTAALENVLEGVPADALRRATASLIDTYRSGSPPSRQVVGDPTAAAAYAAYRMPATHAAVSRALRHATDLADLEVRSVLDVGGGTGAATWAAAEAFPALASATVLDASADALALGRRIAEARAGSGGRGHLAAPGARAGHRSAAGGPGRPQLSPRGAARRPPCTTSSTRR